MFFKKVASSFFEIFIFFSLLVSCLVEICSDQVLDVDVELVFQNVIIFEAVVDTFRKKRLRETEEVK